MLLEARKPSEARTLPALNDLLHEEVLVLDNKHRGSPATMARPVPEVGIPGVRSDAGCGQLPPSDWLPLRFRDEHREEHRVKVRGPASDCGGHRAGDPPGVAPAHLGTRIFVTFNDIFGQFLSFSIPLIIVGLSPRPSGSWGAEPVSGWR